MTYRAPIPKKASPGLNSHFDYSPSVSPQPVWCDDPGCSIPSLEELLDDCFKRAIGQPLPESRALVAGAFERFVHLLHTQENLSFLIEIFKYEYYYDKIFPENIERLRLASSSPVQYSNSFLNKSLDRSIDSLPHPSQLQPTPHRRLLLKVSIRSEDHEPTSVFASALELDESPMELAWGGLRDNIIDSPPDLSSDDESDDKHLLTTQWNLIVESYINNDAPDQINLSNKSSREILQEDTHNSGIHNPLVLLRAKNEILQLIKENAYLSFIKAHRRPVSSSSSDTPEDKPKPPISTPALSPVEHKPDRDLCLPLHNDNSLLSSISNLFGHLKIHHSHSSPVSRAQTPVNITRAVTPVSHKDKCLETLPQECLLPSLAFKLGKLWRKKK